MGCFSSHRVAETLVMLNYTVRHACFGGTWQWCMHASQLCLVLHSMQAGKAAAPAALPRLPLRIGMWHGLPHNSHSADSIAAGWETWMPTAGLPLSTCAFHCPYLAGCGRDWRRLRELDAGRLAALIN